MPDSATHTVVALANFINTEQHDELEKIACAYHWVVQQLDYNADSMYSFSVGDNEQLLVSATLRRRKGVCENYAGLLVAILKEMNVNAVVVKGYVKENKQLRRAGHSWVSFQYQQKWWLCDPTWENKKATSYNYWLKKGEDFIETHMPFDPIWQLLPNPWRYDEFNHDYRRRNEPARWWNYDDSIRSMLNSNDSAKFRAAYRRIKANGSPNLLVKTWIDYLQMKIAIEFEKKDELIYQQVVAVMNEVTFNYNQYAEWRNTYSYAPDQIVRMKEKLQGTLVLLAKVKLQAGLIGKDFPNQQYDVNYLLESIQVLNEKCTSAAKWVAALKAP